MDFKHYLGKIQDKIKDGKSNQESESVEEVKPESVEEINKKSVFSENADDS